VIQRVLISFFDDHLGSGMLKALLLEPLARLLLRRVVDVVDLAHHLP